MTGKTLVENAVHRRTSGGKLPVYFHFADKHTEKKYAEYFGMEQDEFYKWMDNDIRDIFLLEDIQMICSEKEKLEKAYEYGFAVNIGKPGIARDVWGCGWSVDCLGQELRMSPISDMEQVYHYTYPDPGKEGIFYQAREAIAENEAGGYASFTAQYYSLFERAWSMTGYENFLAACYAEPEEVEFLLDRITENKVRMAEQICSLGVTIGHTGDDFGLQRGGVMSLELFRKFFKPRYEKIWGVYKKHGIPVMHHSCGDCRMYLEDMIDAGLDMLHPVQQTCMDIRDLAERYGRDLSFFGSIDTINVLTNGTEDEVRRNVDQTVEILGRYHGLVLSMINVLPNVPEKNVAAAMRQMMEYRGR